MSHRLPTASRHTTAERRCASARAGVCLQLAALITSGCALGSSPLLHHPNDAGKFDGYIGFSLPIQPAQATITTSTSRQPLVSTSHVVRTSTTGLIRPAPGVWPYNIAYLYDPKLFGSVGLTSRMTLVGELAWHRIGISLDYFTREEGRRGFKFALGATSGTGVQELYGWLDIGWLPAFSPEWSGYIGFGPSIGNFRHIFTIPEHVAVDDSDGDGVMPTTASFADLLRREVRLRLPLGVSARPQASKGKRASACLAVIPYVTAAHRDPAIVNCRDCYGVTKIEAMKQNWGIEFDVGGRF